MSDTLGILNDLHKSGIDYEIRSLEKIQGFYTVLGSVESGLCRGEICATLPAAAVFLMRSAFIYYPDSEFTRKYET